MKPVPPVNLGLALTRPKLDALIRQTQLFKRIRGDFVAVFGACHKGPVICSYLLCGGEIVIECAECRRPVCRIKVHDPTELIRN